MLKFISEDRTIDEILHNKTLRKIRCQSATIQYNSKKNCLCKIRCQPATMQYKSLKKIVYFFYGK